MATTSLERVLHTQPGPGRHHTEVFQYQEPVLETEGQNINSRSDRAVPPRNSPTIPLPLPLTHHRCPESPLIKQASIQPYLPRPEALAFSPTITQHVQSFLPSMTSRIESQSLVLQLHDTHSSAPLAGHRSIRPASAPPPLSHRRASIYPNPTTIE
jgi:hypothetical protein